MAQPLVSIQCTVYNHEPYLRQCLDGFVMQKTNFPFEAIVHDDASTDHSADIIREYAEKYPDIIKPIYETENQWSKHDGNLAHIMDKACHGKYIAICEGDDYWTDPLKLQKQVDFLEKNPLVTMVHTGFQPVDVNSNKVNVPYLENYMKISKSGNVFVQLIKGNYPLTLTVMVHRKVIESEIYKKCPSYLDYATFLSAASLGEIVYIPERTGCYRITPTGAMHTANKYVNSNLQIIRLYFLKCALKKEIKTLRETDKKSISYEIWRRVISFHPSKVFLYLILRFPSMLLYMPYCLKKRIREFLK